MQENSDSVKSTIILDEEVINLEKHRLANPSYFPCYIQLNETTAVPALFTQHEIDVAMKRASNNTEDFGDAAEEKSWLERIFR